MTLSGTVLRMWNAGGPTARRFAFIALAAMLASSVSASLSPLLLQVLVDDLIQHNAAGLIRRTALVILAYVALMWLSKTTREVQELFLSRSDQRFNRRLSSDYFRHLVSLPLPFHINRRSGAVSQTLTNGLLGFRIILQHLVNSIVPLIVEFAAMTVILAAAGHLAFVGIFAVALTMYILVFWFGTASVNRLARNASRAQVDSGAIFTDSVLNVEAVKTFHAEARFARRFGTALRRTEGCWRVLFDRKTVNGIWIACIFALTLGASIFVALRQYYAGEITVGELVLVNAYMLQLVRPVEAAGFALRDVAEGRAFIEQMAEVLSLAPEAASRVPAPSGRVFDGSIRFEDISFAYDGKRPVIRHLTLEVPAGSTVAIVGKSGSGKSSIARLLLRLLEPTDGYIGVGRKRLSDIPVAALRNAIGLVPQDPMLIDDSIAYNIALGKSRSSRDEVVAASRIAGLHEFVASLPSGYDTKVGERGLKLSGGERQRVAIARAVVRRPELFIFDEATSSLDPPTESEVARNLNRVSKGATAIVITHRLTTVRYADQIVVLNNGAVAEKGVHDELIALDGLYAGMWQARHREGLDASVIEDASTCPVRTVGADCG